MGCYTCLARRIKCDTENGECENCKRINEPCRMSPTELPKGKKYTQAGTKRRRTLSSCKRCRKLKRKCDGERPCSRCEKNKADCIYSVSDEGTSFANTCGSKTFPDPGLLRDLVETFFEQVAPCRLLGFLHKPTFMLKLDNGIKDNEDDVILLLAICAVASKVNHGLDPVIWEKGTQWAKDSSSMLMGSLNKISVARLMAVVLLHEHEMRLGNYGACFLWGSLIARYTQMLQLNIEYDKDPTDSSRMSIREKESRRRLMWCAYHIDSIQASGIDQLQFIQERDLHLQLPMSDEAFLFERPVKTQKFQDAPHHLTPNMDHRACLIRIFHVRSKVLTYVKRFDQDIELFDGNSEFMQILGDLEAWFNMLPDDLKINATNVYIRKEQALLSSLVMLHMLFHLCYLDLYRLILPGLSYSMKSEIDAVQLAAPASFLEYHQHQCFIHAAEISTIFSLALKYPEDLHDQSLVIAAHEASRAEILYVELKSSQRQAVGDILDYLKWNLGYLREMIKRFPSVKPCLDRTEAFILKYGYPIPVSTAELEFNIQHHGKIEENLHPLASFRTARDTVDESERHGDESDPTPHPPPQPSDGTTTTTSVTTHLDESMFLLNTMESWLLNNQFGELS